MEETFLLVLYLSIIVAIWVLCRLMIALTRALDAEENSPSPSDHRPTRPQRFIQVPPHLGVLGRDGVRRPDLDRGPP